MRALYLLLKEEEEWREGRMMYEMATIFDIYWTETDNERSNEERDGRGGEWVADAAKEAREQVPEIGALTFAWGKRMRMGRRRVTRWGNPISQQGGDEEEEEGA